MPVHYKDILSIDKIIDVYKNICTNTCHKEKLVRFEMSFSGNVARILAVLKAHKYKHQPYCLFLISQPKYRIIMSECIFDKIINHLISKYVLLPELYPKLIDMNVATRKGKGSKAGIYYVKKYINNLKANHKKIYVLKCDISKYFYNIDHDILLKKLENDISDKELLEVIREIVCSTDNSYVNNQINNIINKEIKRLNDRKFADADIKIKELKRLPRYKKGVGLPIGNETSQILAIYYLNELDHFIKEQLHIKCYVRYMDDFILFHYDKDYLKECLPKIEDKISSLHLQLNRKTQIYDLHMGFNFLGYKFKLKNKKLIILINNQNKKKIKRKLKKIKKNNKSHYKQIRASYNGYFKRANAKNFLHKIKF